MPTTQMENTLVRYAREREEKARTELARLKEEASLGALPYEDVNSKYPGSTEVEYGKLRDAITELAAAEATLAAAVQVKTFVCKDPPPCGPNHIHIHMKDFGF